MSNAKELTAEQYRQFVSDKIQKIQQIKTAITNAPTNADISAEIAELWQIAKKRGMAQVDICRATGVKKAAVCEIVNGKTSYKHTTLLSVAASIAAFLQERPDTEFLYPWQDAPVWAKYATTDLSGICTWWEIKPKKNTEFGVWNEQHNQRAVFQSLPKCEAWEYSLQKRQQ